MSILKFLEEKSTILRLKYYNVSYHVIQSLHSTPNLQFYIPEFMFLRQNHMIQSITTGNGCCNASNYHYILTNNEKM